MIVMMKTAYIQPQPEIVNVTLFGSMMEDTDNPTLGAASYMDTTEEYGARQQSNIFEEDEEEGMYSMWATQKSLFEK